MGVTPSFLLYIITCSSMSFLSYQSSSVLEPPMYTQSFSLPLQTLSLSQFIISIFLSSTSTGEVDLGTFQYFLSCCLPECFGTSLQPQLPIQGQQSTAATSGTRAPVYSHNYRYKGTSLQPQLPCQGHQSTVAAAVPGAPVYSHSLRTCLGCTNGYPL